MYVLHSTLRCIEISFSLSFRTLRQHSRRYMVLAAHHPLSQYTLPDDADVSSDRATIWVTV